MKVYACCPCDNVTYYTCDQSETGFLLHHRKCATANHNRSWSFHYSI